MIRELQEIRKIQKRPDGIFGTFMTRPVSPLIAYISLKLRLTPNIVSFISLIFCVCAVIALFYSPDYSFYIVAAVLWWIGAIFDAADGDLARYSNQMSAFGGWFDSFLDRIKEILIFSSFGYLAYTIHKDELYLLLGILSISSTVMSGYVSDTKKLFIDKRKPEIQLGRKYVFGMVDTRDFFIILALLINDIRIALFLYSSIFILALVIQVIFFSRKYTK